MTSPRIQDSDQKKKKKEKKVAFQINPKMVMFSHEVGGSHAVLQTFGAVIGMPSMHLKTFQGHDKKITGLCLIFFLFRCWLHDLPDPLLAFSFVLDSKHVL